VLPGRYVVVTIGIVNCFQTIDIINIIQLHGMIYEILVNETIDYCAKIKTNILKIMAKNPFAIIKMLFF